MSRTIIHNTAASRFEYTEDQQLCVLDYKLTAAQNGQTIANFHHTGVPQAVGGRGIAADLVKFGLDTARKNGWQIQADCSYVAAYIQRNTQYQDLLI